MYNYYMLCIYNYSLLHINKKILYICINFYNCFPLERKNYFIKLSTACTIYIFVLG